MTRAAFPRLARLAGWRYTRWNQPDQGQVLLLKVTDGPQSELGKDVHVPVTVRDLPTLEGIVAALRAIDT